MNEERGTTALGGGHIALFLLNIGYGLSLSRVGPAFRRRVVSHVNAQSEICRGLLPYALCPAAILAWTSKPRTNLLCFVSQPNCTSNAPRAGRSARSTAERTARSVGRRPKIRPNHRRPRRSPSLLAACATSRARRRAGRVLSRRRIPAAYPSLPTQDKDCQKGGGFLQCPTCWAVGTRYGGKTAQCGPPA